MCDTHNPSRPAQLMRPGIGRKASCTLGDCLTSRPKGCSWPRELWFSIYSCAYLHVCETPITYVLVDIGLSLE